MSILLIIISLITFLYGLKDKENKINPLTLFGGLWTIIYILYLIHGFNLNYADDSSLYVLITGALSFFLGYIAYGIKKRTKTKTNNKKKDHFKINYILVYIFSLLSALLLLKDLVVIISNIDATSSLQDIRNLAQDSSSVLYENRGSFENFLRMFILLPTISALQPLTAIDLIVNKNKKLLIIDIVVILLRMMTDGSRNLIVVLLFYMVIVYCYAKHSKKIKKQTFQKGRKFKIFIMVISALALLATASLSRSKDSVVRDTYYYYSMEPVMFDYWKKFADENKVNNFGLTSFNGAIYPVVYLVKNTFQGNYPEWWYNNVFLLLDKNDKYWIPISSDERKANAYVTLYFQFYADGGYIGVTLLSFIYGYLSYYIYDKYLKNKNIKYLALLLAYYYGLLYSYVRFQFSMPTYVLSIVLLCFIFIRKDGNNNESNKKELHL